MTDLVPLGDRAFLARFDDEDAAARWAETLREAGWLGVVDVVTAYQTVGIYADPDRVDLDDLEGRLAGLETAAGRRPEGRLVTIPVLYDGEDLQDVAGRLGISPADVVSAHAAHDYRVFALGFQPGFPYAGYLPEAIAGLPRRTSPRTRVPAGSVAIVGRQTGIYPSPLPGGWHLIGRTPLRIVDPAAGHFPIRAGDRLRFVAVDAGAFAGLEGALL